MLILDCLQKVGCLPASQLHFFILVLCKSSVYICVRFSYQCLYFPAYYCVNSGLAAVFASRLIPLFECLALHVPPESNIPQICLSVLSLLTKHAPCLEAMVAERTSLTLIFQILHCNPPCRDGALVVLNSLASTPELAWAAAKHGGVA